MGPYVSKVLFRAVVVSGIVSPMMVDMQIM